MSEPLDQPSEARPAEDVSVNGASEPKQPSPNADVQPQPSVDSDTLMQDGSAPIPESTAVKRASSHDSDDGDRAAKRVKEDHPVSLSGSGLLSSLTRRRSPHRNQHLPRLRNPHRTACKCQNHHRRRRHLNSHRNRCEKTAYPQPVRVQ